MPVDYRMTLSSVLAATVAYLFVFLVPVAPLYCGWRVHCRYRARTLGLARASRPSRLWVYAADRFMGTAAILIGLAYGLHFFIHVAPHILLGFIGMDGFTSADIRSLTLGGLLLLAIAVLCAAVIMCGILSWRTNFVRPKSAPLSNRWPLLVGDFSLFAGGLGIFPMLGLLVQLLPS